MSRRDGGFPTTSLGSSLGITIARECEEVVEQLWRNVEKSGEAGRSC
jgi:hypothetical protein